MMGNGELSAMTDGVLMTLTLSVERLVSQVPHHTKIKHISDKAPAKYG